jgi:putative acetyltransferase
VASGALLVLTGAYVVAYWLTLGFWPHSGHVEVRREGAADAEAIRAVIAAAFARGAAPDEVPPEVALVDELRAGDAWLPALSLVATGPGGDVIGHVLCTRGWVSSTAAVALGPPGVHPSQQRRGVGRGLMHAVLGAADALGEPLVAVLGDPGYYSQFGFHLADRYGITPPEPGWRPHFQVRPLTAYRASLRGRFTYAEPFGRR